VYGAVGESTVVPAGASPAPRSNVNLSRATIDVGQGSSMTNTLKVESRGNIFTPLTGGLGVGGDLGGHGLVDLLAGGGLALPQFHQQLAEALLEGVFEALLKHLLQRIASKLVDLLQIDECTS
jgi:hypothetical protein